MEKHLEIIGENYENAVKEYDTVEFTEENRRCCNDLLRNANTGMMSWAEKNFKQKLIDLLHQKGYYKDNQTIYLKPKK